MWPAPSMAVVCLAASLAASLASCHPARPAAPAATAAPVEPRCDAGDTSGCVELARRFEQGRAVARDRSKPFERLSADAVAVYFAVCPWSAEQWCQNLWFDVYLQVPGVAEDTEEAKALYRRGCEAGDLVACNGLAWLLGFRYLTGPSEERAVALFEKACAGAVWPACRNLATLVLARRIFSPADLASREYQACGQGDKLACGYMYDAPSRRALALYQRACDGDDPPSCSRLADLLREGRGPDGTDLPRAVQLHRRSCNAGHLVACRNLGDQLQSGAGLPKDIPAALALYERACAGDEMLACYRVATVLAQQQQDLDRASRLFHRVCHTGVLEACPTP